MLNKRNNILSLFGMKIVKIFVMREKKFLVKKLKKNKSYIIIYYRIDFIKFM